MCMEKSNVSRSFSNRRAVVPGRNPVVVYQQYKHDMKQVEVLQELDVAKYQAKKRYIQNMTLPIPNFVYEEILDVPHYCCHQSDSVVSETLISSDYYQRLQNSSFKDLYARVMMEYQCTILTSAPRDAKEWYYATGGIMPYCK